MDEWMLHVREGKRQAALLKAALERIVKALADLKALG